MTAHRRVLVMGVLVMWVLLASLDIPASAQRVAPSSTQPSTPSPDQPSQTGQPPISIELTKDAGYTQVADALSKVTGTKCVVARPALEESEQSGDRFEIHATARPFWEVFEQLDRQHAMSFVFPGYDRGAVVALVPRTRRSGRGATTTSPMRHERAGDFMVFFTVAGRTRPNTPLLLHWSVVSDLRLEMAHVEVVGVGANDEAGNVFSAVGHTQANGSPTRRQFSLQTQLSEPLKPLGSKLNVKADLSIDVFRPLTIHVECQDVAVRP